MKDVLLEKCQIYFKSLEVTARQYQTMTESGQQQQQIEVVDLEQSSPTDKSALPLRQRLKKLNIIQLQQELRNFGRNVQVSGNKDVLIERLAHLDHSFLKIYC